MMFPAATDALKWLNILEIHNKRWKYQINFPPAFPKC